MNTSQFFRALSDTTRLRCVALLVQHEELCVCELTHALGLAQPKISHHLAALRKASLVSDRKEGLWIYYRLNPALEQWMLDTLVITAEGVKRTAPFTDDARRLESMANRPGGICAA